MDSGLRIMPGPAIMINLVGNQSCQRMTSFFISTPLQMM